MENFTVEDFYNNLLESMSSSSGLKNTLEFELPLRLIADLEDAGVISGYEHCHYKPPRGMRVDAYWFREDESSLDLFIFDDENRSSLETLTKTDVNSIFKRLENFFINSVGRNFYEDLEGLPVYGLARDISDRRHLYSKVNLYLVSERNLSERMHALEDIIFQQWALSFHVWDMSRFFRQYTSTGAKEDLIVDFSELCEGGLQCLPAHLNSDDYESYLLVMPANILANLYGKYGARLLEQNVRCFLQARGNVNKGIRSTIMNDPGMFFAYNNGITATAKEVTVEQAAGGIFIKQVRDLQIVNGGQTTASLFHTNRKDKASLDNVFIQMKLSIVAEEKSEEVVPKISEYANTQNKVNAADFFSNHPFHVRMEEFSRRILAPPVPGALRESKWFYERARGQYADAQTKFTPAGRKKFKEEYPKQRMFTKTDLAKFENVWDENPKFVNLGAQKNFAKYAERIGREWGKSSDVFNEFYYKRAVARGILFRRTEKLVSSQSWYQGGYRANIVAYTLAIIGELCRFRKQSFDFMQVWKNQYVSPATVEALEALSELVSDEISTPPDGIANISEWCKKDACWTRLKEKLTEFDCLLPKQFVSEFVSTEKIHEEAVDAKKIQKVDNGIEAQTRVFQLSGRQWLGIMEEGLERGLFTPKEIGILNTATKIPNVIPSEKQSMILVDILNKIELEGITF